MTLIEGALATGVLSSTVGGATTGAILFKGYKRKKAWLNRIVASTEQTELSQCQWPGIMPSEEEQCVLMPPTQPRLH